MEPNASTMRLNALLQKTQSNGGGTVVPGVAPENAAKLDAIFNQVAPTAPKAPEPIEEKKSVGGFIKNVGSSGSDLIGGIINALVHPIDTGRNLGNLALGGGQKLVGYEGNAASKVDQVVQYYKNRYGKDIGSTLYEDPVGVLADLSTLLGGGGALLRGASKVAGVSDVARISGATGNALRYGKLADKAAVATDPLRMAGKAAGFISKETGATDALVKAKQFTAGLFKGDDAATATRGAEVANKGIRGKLDEMALNAGMDQPTKTILRKPLPGEKPAQTAARLEKEYQKYYKIEENYKLDPRADTALEAVGSEIGNAYKTVIGKQQELGKLIGQARKEATTPVNIKPAQDFINSELKGNGIIITPKGYKIEKGYTTKLTAREISELIKARKELIKLSKNPSAENLSNFKQRIAKDIDFSKPMGKSLPDAERIMRGTYDALAEALNVKGSPDLQGIYALNKEYERLSKLLDEGEGILGKKTLTGDYKHDASIAKASIKSLHAGGKKDFLKALGKEVKDDFIQKAMTAAQAMKDIGNYKQASLLEELAKGLTGANDQLRVIVGARGIQPQAILRQGIDKVVGGVMEKVGGSPKNRTIKYIKEGGPKTRTTAKPTPKPSLIRNALKQFGGTSQIRTRNAVLREALGNDYEE